LTRARRLTRAVPRHVPARPRALQLQRHDRDRALRHATLRALGKERPIFFATSRAAPRFVT
jgi:hypothetical protein